MPLNEKSLAVECMHRLRKHMKDVLDGKTGQLPDEFFQIFHVWDVRTNFDGADLNKSLETLRNIEKHGVDALGWIEGRGKISTKGKT